MSILCSQIREKKKHETRTGKSIERLRRISVRISNMQSKGSAVLIKTNTCRSEETPRLRREQRSRIGLNSLYVRFTIKHLIRAVSLGPTPKKKKFSEWVYMLRLYLRGRGVGGRRERRRNKTLRSLHKQRLRLRSFSSLKPSVRRRRQTGLFHCR